MRRLALLLPIALVAACKTPAGDYPTLAARPTEAIDPRLPIDASPSPGTLDLSLASRLAEAVSKARAGISEFERLSGAAEALAAGAGPARSESWVAAQQALSLLVAQHGITTRAAADIDAIAGDRIKAARWLAPANRAAIEAAAAEVDSINSAQTARLQRIAARLVN
ncbi:MAG: hypothetical protein M3Q57_00230 [Pseudomonadota bacterium]|nr:hypothetical protein [Pseudomonadota bacterium]